MKNILKAAPVAVLGVAALLGAASSAKADLTMQGAVGLPLNPTAQIPQVGGIRVQGNYYDLGDLGDGGDDLQYYGLFAAGRMASTLEINGGISHTDAGDLGDSFDGIDRTGFTIGAKYLLTRETDPLGVRFAVGAGYDRALANNIHVYGVATKSFGNFADGNSGRPPITGHLGVRYDRFDFDSNVGGVDDDSSKVSLFAGVEVPITRTGAFTLIGELQSKNVDDGKVPYSLGVRFRPAGRPYSASVGLVRQGLVDDTSFYAQLGYTFDAGANNQ